MESGCFEAMELYSDGGLGLTVDGVVRDCVVPEASTMRRSKGERTEIDECLGK
jgi:hypothetical protein